MMKKIASTEVIDPTLLRGEQERRLIKALFQVHAQIFSGIGEEAFADHIVRSPAKRTRIKVFKNDRGNPVGYCAVHRFEKSLRGSYCTVFRAEAGLFREYRRRGSIFLFGWTEAFRYSLLHPLQRVYYLGMLVHPSMYRIMSSYFSEIYPSHKYETPEAIRHFMCDLADCFGVKAVNDSNRLIRQVGWVTRDSEEEVEYWRCSDQPDVQLFLRQNPGYRDGHGLVTLVPLTLANMLLALWLYAKAKISRRLRGST
jgi:hypothetical protein